MRHRKKFNHLSRTNTHRKAMLSNMATSLIIHKRINTTLAKAKALRGYIEPLITRSKEDTTHSRRMIFKYLQSKEAVTELFREIAVKVADRPGGYTRILKTGTRLGDNAEMALIELVDYNETYLTEKEAKQAKTTRRRRGAKKKVQDEIPEEVKDTTEEIIPEDENVAEIEEVVEVAEAEEVVEVKGAEKTEETETVDKKAEVVPEATDEKDEVAPAVEEGDSPPSEIEQEKAKPEEKNG